MTHYTSPRLNAIRTALYALLGRAPTQAEMSQFHRRLHRDTNHKEFRNAPAR